MRAKSVSMRRDQDYSNTSKILIPFFFLLNYKSNLHILQLQRTQTAWRAQRPRSPSRSIIATIYRFSLEARKKKCQRRCKIGDSYLIASTDQSDGAAATRPTHGSVNGMCAIFANMKNSDQRFQRTIKYFIFFAPEITSWFANAEKDAHAYRAVRRLYAAVVRQRRDLGQRLSMTKTKIEKSNAKYSTPNGCRRDEFRACSKYLNTIT